MNNFFSFKAQTYFFPPSWSNFEVQTPKCPFIQRFKGLWAAKANLRSSFLFAHIKDFTASCWIQILPLRNQNTTAIQRSHQWNHRGFSLIWREKTQQAKFACTGLLAWGPCYLPAASSSRQSDFLTYNPAKWQPQKSVPWCSLRAL